MFGENQQVPHAGGSYSKGMTISGITYGLIYLSAIPLLYFFWRLGRTTFGTLGIVYLGAFGFLFLIQFLDHFIPKELPALAFIMAGGGK